MRQVENRKIYTVSEVNYFAKQTLEAMIFWVEGEIQTIKKNPDWVFYYLDLKDEWATLPCIADKSLLEKFNDDATGQKVLVYGNLTLYEPTGKYQFRIYQIEKAGVGFLQRQLEELIRKLKAEGLFDQRYKKQIPKYPKKICVVTSVGSDAYNDFVKHTVDKFPIIELYVADVRVQGKRSVRQLLEILPKVDAADFDVIVITRGGGSLEDLAAFNDEQVTRTIFKMKTPAIVAIGHETNESLAEWVADRRASTPTDAANMITTGYASVLTTLDNIKYQLQTKTNYYFATNFQKLDYIYLALEHLKLSFKDLPAKLETFAQILKRHKILIENARDMQENLFLKLKRHGEEFTRNYSYILTNLEKSLALLSPENTIKRGYSITTNEKGQIIRNIRDVVVGNIIGVKLTGGNLTSKVLTKKENG